MKTLLELEQEFLYKFAIAEREELVSLLKNCSAQKLEAIIECVLNIKKFTNCKTLNKSAQRIRARWERSENSWRYTLIGSRESTRRMVARVVRVVLLAEIILLLCSHNENSTCN